MTDPVTPETRIGALLAEHPELEDVLIGLSPRFAALRNPVLRRTVARVATLAQAARIAEMPVPHLVNALRHALGQAPLDLALAAEAAAAPEPDWVRGCAPAVTLDALAIMDRGGTPLAEVAAALREIEPGAVLVLDAPFAPAPLIDAMKKAGHDVHAVPLDGPWRVYVRAASRP